MDAFANDLQAARSEVYVPRPTAERAFDDLLASEEAGILFVAGPGGIGKSTLLAHLRQTAQQRDWSVRSIDLRDLPPRPALVRGALEGIEARCCLFLDGFEEHASLERRYFAEWLSALPRNIRIVVAGRHEPEPSLLRRTGWWKLTRVVVLDPMSDSEAAALLARHGVPDTEMAARIAAGEGHPLTLARLAALDFLPTGEVTDAWLTETLIGSVSTARERIVLALAMAEGCDRALLAALVPDDDVEALEIWLQRQPFVTLGREGWLLHQCYSDAVLRQARRAAPEVYQAMLKNAAEHLSQRLVVEQSPDARRSVLRRAFAMTRLQAPAIDQLPRIEPGQRSWDAFEENDRRLLLDAVRRHEGPESADVLAHHLDRDPGRVTVLRDGEGLARGVLCEVHDEDVDATDRAVDRGIASMQRLQGPTHLVRHWMCLEHHQQACPTSAAVLREFVGHAYARAGLVHHAVVDPAKRTGGAQTWLARGTLEVLDDDAFEEDGRQVRLVGWDLRERGFPERLRQVMLLHLGEAPVPASPPGAANRPIGDLEAELGQALRHFHDDDRLAESPLRTLVPGAPTAGRAPDVRDTAAAVRALLRSEARQLPATARFEAPGDLLARTYFASPVPKQLRVAAELGMAHSTFRRHLAQARRALTRRLQARTGRPVSLEAPSATATSI